MHFGLYLKNKGIISAEQLVAALEAQLATLPRIGQLALEEGIISPRGIFEVLQAQRRSPDVRFGELAIEMRLITRSELTRLLMIQADRKRPLAEVFVKEGILNERQVSQEMAEFHVLQANRRATRESQLKVVPAPRGHASVMHAMELSSSIS
jgi:hypothetical protein